MALVPTVTKVSVKESMDKMWIVTLNLSVEDDVLVEEVINQDFSLRYRQGQDIEAKVKAIKDEVQEAIDDYKQEQVYFKHTKLNDAVTWLNANVTG